jgi:glycosyltransferase involved in cell wall biosynthesis
MRVLLRAPLLTNSGYGVHSRQLFEWLCEKKDVELDVECLNWGQTPWVIDREKEHGLIGKIMDRSRSLEPPYDMTFQVQLPDEWDEKLGKINVGVSAFVETDRCSPKWVEACNKMDMIVVPSTFTKNVVKRSGILMRKIHVVPEWFNHDILDTEKCNKILNEDARYEFSTNSNYLIIAQLTAQEPELDRKNLFNTLKWLFEYHKDDDDVGIILKTNLGRGTVLDKMKTVEYVDMLIKRFKKGHGPKLHLVHGNMTGDEVAALYHLPSLIGYISATRGEGYGLPLIDAAAAGLPVIATNWSGHLEFLKKNTFIPLDYEMKEISEKKLDNRIFYKGFKWAEPTKKSFFDCLKNLNDNQDLHKAKAKDTASEVSETFHKKEIKQKYNKILDDLSRKS